MRVTKAKLFPKTLPYGKRNYFVLLFRYLLSQPAPLLFLHYDGDSSEKLNELRYLAAHHQVSVHLLLRRWIASIFSKSPVSSLQCRLLVLWGPTKESLLTLVQKPQFSSLLENFPFFLLSSQGLLSQEPFFFLLSQPKGLFFLRLLLFLQYRLLMVWRLPLQTFLKVLQLLHLSVLPKQK